MCDLNFRLNMAMRATLATLVLCAAVLSAQAPTPIPTSTDVAFEVTSVKPNNSGDTSSSTGGRGGSFTARNVTLRRLIVYAYRLREFQIAGGPGWLTVDRFDIQARAPENTKAVNTAMTRALLKDRFKLVAHTETRQEQVYALVVARADGTLGPAMKPSTRECLPAQPGAPSACGTNVTTGDTGGRLTATGQPVAGLAAALGSFGLSRMVLDRTGLTGNFDFELQWTPDNLRSAAANPMGDSPSIFAALQEQLGLRLESQRGPVEFLIVDSVERPAPD
jgi:uncharacterized protein (TIGR03435 family)